MINYTQPLAPELQIRVYETQLKMENIQADVFTLRSADMVFSGEDRVEIPDAIFVNLTAEAAKARTVRMPLLKALSGAPTIGSAMDQRGREEDIDVKWADFYYNDWSHAVSGQEYGILAKDKEPYQIFQKITSLLALYDKETEGKYCRQALLERYSENLAVAPLFLTMELTPNVFIAGLSNQQQPLYNVSGSTRQTWVNAVAGAVATAETVANAAIGVPYLQRLEEWASTGIGGALCEQISVGGKDTYVVTVPSNQMTWLKHPTNPTSLGIMFRDYAALSTEDLKFPGAFGRVGKLLLCEDQRWPTLTPGGTGDARTLTARYKNPGRGVDSDPRDMTIAGRDVGFLLAKGAVVKWMKEPYHFEHDYLQYDKYYGKGNFCSHGFQQVQYDYGTSTRADETTRQMDGSIALIMAKPPQSA